MTEPFVTFLDDFWKVTEAEYIELAVVVEQYFLNTPYSSNKVAILTRDWEETKKGIVKFLLQHKRLYRCLEKKGTNVQYDVIESLNPYHYLQWYSLHVRV